MKDPDSKLAPGLIILCILLGLAGLIFAGLGLWLLFNHYPLYGSISLAVSGLALASAWGLFQRRKWGIILFGILGLLGSANHLSSTLNRNTDLSHAGLAQVMGALFSIVLAIFIPIGMIYLALLLWRRL